MMTTADLTVATTIRSQIGVAALFMMGAHTLTADETTFGFYVCGSRTCNHVSITLSASDTYTVTTRKIRGVKVTKVDEMTDIYVDQLHAVLEQMTGLRTSL